MSQNIKSPKKTKKSNKLKKVLRHIISTTIWVYIVTTFLFFNIDHFIVSEYPNIEKYIEYKFVFLIFIIATTWLALGSKRFIINFLYLLLYPALLILSIIFKMLGFSPNSFLAVLGYCLWAIKSAKSWFIVSSFYFTFFALIYLDFNNYLTVLSMSLLFLLLIYHYFERIHTAFRPETVISSVNKFINTRWNDYRDKIISTQINDTKSEKLNNNEFILENFDKLMLIILINIGYKFIITKLKTFQESRILAVSSILKILITLFITVISYGFLYLGLEKLIPNSFTINTNPGIFYYVYASFNTMLTVGIPDFIPSNSWAKVLVTTEQICSISIMVFLFFVFTTIVRERHQEELDDLIKTIDKENNLLIAILPTNFNVTFEQIQNLECFEDDEHKKQIEGILKFKTDVLKITD